MGVTASRTLSVAASPTDLSDITFRIVDQSRYPEIMDLLYANFHTDEPMSRALSIYDGVHRVPAIDEYTLAALNENLSIMAVDSITNKLLGVAINGIFTREFAQNSLEHKDGYPRGDKFRHIIGALHKVNTLAPNLHDELGGEAIFDIKMVTTDKLNRRSGLGTDLIRRSVELARSLGYKACKTEATGRFSRKAFERLGFIVIAELLYSDYEDEDEADEEKKKVFASIENHRGVALLTKKLIPKQDSIEEKDELFSTTANDASKFDEGQAR